MVIFGFSYQTKLCDAPGCQQKSYLPAIACSTHIDFHHQAATNFLMMNQISNLQKPQCFLDTQGYPVGRLKHGLPGPPDVMFRALRHGVGKFVGLENSKGESGIIACRSLK
jgi:hypothetical protein